MSKQRGKGDRRKRWHKEGQKHHRSNAEQHDKKFDEERFSRDMESALNCMALCYYRILFEYLVYMILHFLLVIHRHVNFP